jgi:phosphotransacetylase
MIKNFKELIEVARQIGSKREGPLTIALAAAHDVAALQALIEAQKLGLATGILVGDKHKIHQTLDECAPEWLDTFEIIHVEDEHEVAARTISLVHENAADIIMKGKIRSADLLRDVLNRDNGLRTDHLMSDVFIFEYSERQENRLIMISDGGIILAPDLKQKVQIIENAVTVAHALGNENPKVAVLSAVEAVNPELRSTIDAACLSKMNQRGQIRGCIVDGPLALDNAISPEAARLKGIVSPVAGHADILLCPDIEAANMLAKGTTYFAGLPQAHTSIGAKVPVLIPSRADSAEAKLLSIALCVVFSRYVELRRKIGNF